MKNPTHNCPILGPDAILPRAYNTALPNRYFFKCPVCSYLIDPTRNIQYEKESISSEQRTQESNKVVKDTDKGEVASE